ncbi:thioredoxin domain-containing protein [soil metagenome]
MDKKTIDNSDSKPIINAKNSLKETINIPLVTSIKTPEIRKEKLTSNRLINEKSPYLLQHAYNPVDWFPWGEEAFSRARSENKPIFLSIGYSTCYWCHVMEREVFEVKEIADLMNDIFINIKVDREERPDIDRIYMTALQSLTGSGGWPMSMFLTTDLKPFYGATYIPPKAKYGRAGFEDVIGEISKAWNERNSEVQNSSNQITAIISKNLSLKIIDEDTELDKDAFDKIYEQCVNAYDYLEGGFGTGNKFPRPVVLNYLLDHYFYTGKPEAKEMALFTLKKMFDGGMYDHLGGGFHRYSVDTYWRVPHFEKMLYDQAQLVTTYINVYNLTKNEFFLYAAEDILRYVKENLTSPDGAFYSAEDAENSVDENDLHKKEEGAYYLWTEHEVNKILKDAGLDAKVFNYHFGIQPFGNTISDPHEVFGKKNVLHIAFDEYDTAKKFGISIDETLKIISEGKALLRKERAKRIKPHLDDKILTSWNSMMISAYCDAYKATGKEEYLAAAVKCVKFLLKNIYSEEPIELLHRFKDNEARFKGTLEDFAHFTAAMIDIYDATFDLNYLILATGLNNRMIELFYDPNNAGFFDTRSGEKNIIYRTKDTYDGAEPSGNSIAVRNLLRLGKLLDNKDYIGTAEKTLKLYAQDLKKLPFSSPAMVSNLSFFLNGEKEIIVKGDITQQPLKEMLSILNKTFIPHKVMIYSSVLEAELFEFIQEIITDEIETAIYICENYKCNLPVKNTEELEGLLRTFRVPKVESK